MSLVYVIARQLGGKSVITEEGAEVGKLDDLELDGDTGDIISLIVEPDQNAPEGIRYPKDEEGNFKIPYDSVNSVEKFVIVKK